MAKNKKKKFDYKKDKEEKELGKDLFKSDDPRPITKLPGGDSFTEEKEVGSAQAVNITDQALSKPPLVSAVTTASTSVHNAMQIEPTSGVDVVTTNLIGAIAIDGTTIVQSDAGGTTRKVSDASAAPYTSGGKRPYSRYQKSNAQKKSEIDSLVSEQIDVKVRDPKGISETIGQGMGYNGTPHFGNVRAKKNSGTVPQSMLFERSVDFIKHDSIVYSDGQILDSIVSEAGYPTKRRIFGDSGAVTITDPMQKSNYLLNTFNFTLVNGKLATVSFGEDQFIVGATDGETQKANVNWLLDKNYVTQTVLNLQKDLGNESKPNWSPLGSVIDQPYEYSMLEHDIELSTGAIATLAQRASTSAYAYNLNIMAKDGTKGLTPVVDMFLNGIGDTVNSDVAENAVAYGLGSGLHDDGAVFNRALYRQGSAAAMYQYLDTVRKYSEKSDFFTASRTPKNLISTSRNNIGNFRIKSEFLNAVNVAHTFSTPTGSYSPVLPIYATKVISLVNPLSLNYFLKGWSRANSCPENMAGTAAQYGYAYTEHRNEYTQVIKHPLVEGLLTWMIRNEAGLAKVFGDDSGQVSMPATFNMMYPTLFSLMINAAGEDIARSRNTILKETLWAAEDEGDYLWKDLVPIKDINPLFSDQLTITSENEPLKLGKLNVASKVRLIWPELMTVHGEQPLEGAEYIMPFYMNELGYSDIYTSDTGFMDPRNLGVMTVPVTRQDVNHAHIEFLLDMDYKDIRLSYDQMVTIPSYVDKTVSPVDPTVTVYSAKHAVGDVATKNSKIHINALRYDDQSDGRLVVTYDNNLTYASLLCVPRELGFIAPGLPIRTKIITSVDNAGVFIYADTESKDKLIGLDRTIDGSTTFKISTYCARGKNQNMTSISRTAALQQDYLNCYARRDPDISNVINKLYVSETGIIPAFSGIVAPASLDTLDTVNTSVIGIHAIDGSSSVAATNVTSASFITLSRSIWTVIQRLFFAINPFENCLKGGDEGGDAKAGSYFDPMETSFWFGVCGTMAINYDLDIDNRLSAMLTLGIKYTEDSFISNSPIFGARK